MADSQSLLGQTVSHYRIVERLGCGGMGVVYRAHDEQLDRDVAVKVLPTGTLFDETARKQFRAEALALAKLNHPNIETVHEFGTQNGIDFLVMELIPGNSLADRLTRRPLSQQEVVQLGTQLAEGLSAAHDQGVVHRDLKPANLFVTPDGRLKILDFGLAKLIQPDLASEVTTSTTDESPPFSGTLPYMAPEQLRGLPPDLRCDIYSAGVVLYEMATGQRPFPERQSAELIGAILHQMPRPPSAINSHIASSLDAVIGKAMQKEPSQRYSSARELRAALEGVSQTSVTQALGESTRRTYAGAALLALVLLAALLVALNVYGLRDRLRLHNPPTGASTAGTATTPFHPRRSIAVLGFKNLSQRPDELYISTLLQEEMTSELAAGGQLRAIPSETVAQMKVSLALLDADSYGSETLQKIRRNIGSDEVVIGSYLATGNGHVRVDINLEDATTGELMDSVTEYGTEGQLAELVSRAGTALRAKLGARAISSTEAAQVGATLPSNPEAARLYSEGLAKTRSFELAAARDLFQKAIAADPSFALSHAALAGDWSALGYDAKARDEAKKAFDLSGRLSPNDQLWVEAQFWETMHEWGKAAKIYGTLFQSYPDSLDYGLALARAQSFHAGEDALATLEILRKLPSPTGDDPRISLGESLALLSLGNYKQAQTVAGQAAAKAQAQGARLIAASALMNECNALDHLGYVKEALAACTAAQRAHAEAGDRDRVARDMNGIANILQEQGNFVAAKPKYEQALVILREVGDQGGAAVASSNIADILLHGGDLRGSVKMYQQSTAILHEVGDKTNESIDLSCIGVALEALGELPSAQTNEEQALAIARETDNKFGQAVALNNLSEVLYDRGDLSAAKSMLDQSEPLLREMGQKTSLSSTLLDRGRVLLMQDNIHGAKDKYQEALMVSREAGYKQGVARSQLLLADLAVEENRSIDAESLSRQALNEFQAEKDIDDEIMAHAALARALLLAGKASAAQKEIGQASLLATQAAASRWEIALAAGRVESALGDFVAAKTKLEAMLSEATRASFVPYVFEGRLAVGEIEIKSGRAADGRTGLAALEIDAIAKGFVLVARKAATVAKG